MIFVFLGRPVSQKDSLSLPISQGGLDVYIDGFHGDMGNSIHLTNFPNGVVRNNLYYNGFSENG